MVRYRNWLCKLGLHSLPRNKFYNPTIITMYWKTHWMSRTRFYRIYRWIVSRCNLPSINTYKVYWWRWIKCEWNTFEDFYYTMYKSYNEHVKKFGERNTTIERIDVNWNYCIENCRWATTKEQWNNTRSNVPMEYNWITYPSIEVLCEHLWLKYNTVYKRIFLEWQSSKHAIDELITKNNKYKYKWITYKWITDMCKKLWLKRTSIKYRLSIWMSIDEAIETDFRPYNNIKWKDD